MQIMFFAARYYINSWLRARARRNSLSLSFSLRYTLGRSKGMLAYTANGYAPIYFHQRHHFLAKHDADKSHARFIGSVLLCRAGRPTGFGSRISYTVTGHLTLIRSAAYFRFCETVELVLCTTYLRFLNRQKCHMFSIAFYILWKWKPIVPSKPRFNNLRSCILFKSEWSHFKFADIVSFALKINIWICIFPTTKINDIVIVINIVENCERSILIKFYL